MINLQLTKKQNLSEQEIENIKLLHRERAILEQLLETCDDNDLKAYSDSHRENNRLLQKA